MNYEPVIKFKRHLKQHKSETTSGPSVRDSNIKFANADTDGNKLWNEVYH